MRKLTIVLLATLAAAAPAAAESVDCYRNEASACFETKPAPLAKSIDDFKKLRDTLGKDPYGGAQLLIHALLVRQTDKALGDELVTLAVAEEHVEKGGGGYVLKGKAKTWVERAAGQPHCIRGHVAGTSPDTGYVVDAAKIAFRLRRQSSYVGTEESGDYKVFLCATGIDSCRPVRLKRNKNGIWKAFEFSSLATGCRPAKTEDKEASDAADAL